MSSFPTGLFQQLEGSRRNCNEPNPTGQRHFENILDKLICEAYILYEVRNIPEALMPDNRRSLLPPPENCG
jgi:hypothetical protein